MDGFHVLTDPELEFIEAIGRCADVTLAIGDAAFWVARTGPAGQRVQPKAAGDATGRTLLVVDDPDAVFGQAVTSGATPTAQPANEHGWRLARITDPFGHHWEIGRPLGAWPPP